MEVSAWLYVLVINTCCPEESGLVRTKCRKLEVVSKLVGNITEACHLLVWPLLWSSSQSFWLHNGDVLWFRWGTNWIYICYVEKSRPPLCSIGQSSWLHNGDVLWFSWGTNWIYICYVAKSRPPLWSSGQSSWLHIHWSVFDFRHYQIFWEVVGLERGPLSVVNATEELLGRKSSGSGLESREYGRMYQSRWPRDSLNSQKLSISSPKSGYSSVGILRSLIEAT
jgi:hypothetical protein